MTKHIGLSIVTFCLVINFCLAAFNFATGDILLGLFCCVLTAVGVVLMQQWWRQL